MYLLSILAVILCFVVVQCFQTSMGILQFLDIISILFLVMLIVPIMISAGLLKDLNNAFRLVLGKKKEVALLTIKRAKLAVDTMLKIVVYGSVFVLLLQLIVLLHNMADPSTLGPIISVTFLTLLYAMVICLLMMPIRARLEQMILEYMSSCTEEGEAS